MIICGIKLTHDGAIALIDNGKLIFSYEMEKLDNMPRHSDFCITMERVNSILDTYGYSFNRVDQWVLDGWDNWNLHETTTADPGKQNVYTIQLDDANKVEIELADYGHFVERSDDILKSSRFTMKALNLPYKSYKHVTGHVTGAYCTSTFAKKQEDSFILVWDGGMPPQFFYYKYKENKVINLGHLFLLAGHIYINFAHAFKPFCLQERSLSIAGKAMAYVAAGELNPHVLDAYKRIFTNMNNAVSKEPVNMNLVDVLTMEFVKQAKELCSSGNIRHEDMLTTFHFFIQDIIIEELRKKVQEHREFANNLCFAGGSALNIKWNSAIRSSGIFKDIWVPPFPNDSGSALGAACCEMMMSDNIRSLQWNVYSGPVVGDAPADSYPYLSSDCSLEKLAHILHRYNEPIVVLNGSAELGPRSLGNRSIIAAAVDPAMKSRLNMIKGREDYRPVAPICIEEDAPVVFDPGSPDPYMLYEHIVKPGWKNKVPAICHLDGTARLQSVNKNENPVIYELLVQYKKVSGIPLLCNTSANFNGKGFFPDVESVMKWGKVNYIWSNGKLYYKEAAANEMDLVEKNSIAAG
ncbi:MAG: carbamoyltransferase N-terminal domain-containing protein [Chitinophagaceae bacterium]